MQKRMLIKGNHALAEAAIRSGCKFFFGYPITPQTTLLEYMAKRLPEAGGIFLQSESEIAAINMVYGAAATGARAMTASSSPGISLKMEGISYLASAELPCVVVNIMRAGPGLGTITPSQADYFQAVKGGGHGDYRLIVLAPYSVQEMADLAALAFDLADQYRIPVMILADGVIGEMMEGAVLPEHVTSLPPKPWALGAGRPGSPNRVISAPFNTQVELISLNYKLQEKYREIESKEVRWEGYFLDDAELVLIAFGNSARVTLEAVELSRLKGMPVGLLRPITLWPFPVNAFVQLKFVRSFLVIEMNAGQMLEDVKLAVEGRQPVSFFGCLGGQIPSVREICKRIEEYFEGGVVT